jgi:predicted transcriptional regulator
MRKDARWWSRMDERERVEGGRRAKAALAYAGKTAPEIAPELGMSEPTFGRLLAGMRKETSWDDLWKIADCCTLPREWFSADIMRLSEIVPAGQPTFGVRRDLAAKMEQELAARVEQVRRRNEAGARNTRAPRRKAPQR